MLGELPPEPVEPVQPRRRRPHARPRARSTSTCRGATPAVARRAGERIERRRRWLQPAWAQAELVGPSGATPLSSLTPVDDCRAATGDGSDPRDRIADGDGRAREESVRARLRHRRPGLHTLPRRDGAREHAERDRIDAQPADPVLRVRHRAEHGSAGAAAAGRPAAAAAALHTAAEVDRPRLLARCSAARRPTPSAGLRRQRCSDPSSRRPSVAREGWPICSGR